TDRAAVQAATRELREAVRDIEYATETIRGFNGADELERAGKLASGVADGLERRLPRAVPGMGAADVAARQQAQEGLGVRSEADRVEIALRSFPHGKIPQVDLVGEFADLGNALNLVDLEAPRLGRGLGRVREVVAHVEHEMKSMIDAIHEAKDF